MAKVPNDVKNDKNFNRLRRVHERYKRQTDGRAIAYSECEREFTFAKIATTPCVHYQFIYTTVFTHSYKQVL